jgi:hypothetical protein
MSEVEFDQVNKLHNMKSNLRKVFGGAYKKPTTDHRQKMYRRCQYLRDSLSAQSLMKWALATQPNSWNIGRWEGFSNDVKKIKNKEFTFSRQVVESLHKLKEDDHFPQSDSFENFYQGIFLFRSIVNNAEFI